MGRGVERRRARPRQSGDGAGAGPGAGRRVAQLRASLPCVRCCAAPGGRGPRGVCAVAPGHGLTGGRVSRGQGPG